MLADIEVDCDVPGEEDQVLEVGRLAVGDGRLGSLEGRLVVACTNLDSNDERDDGDDDDDDDDDDGDDDGDGDNYDYVK